MLSFLPSLLLLALPLLTAATPVETENTLVPRQFTLLPPGVSADGRCGTQTIANISCVGSPFGYCCSSGGYCGNGTSYCGEGNCQSGNCAKTTAPAGAVYTKDGTCGPKYGNTLCGDKEYGPCCSLYGFCGSDEVHCGAGLCQSGACKGTAPLSGGPSLDSHCGPNFPGNKTCVGTTFGACCSTFGFCGNGTMYCAKATCHSGACLTV